MSIGKSHRRGMFLLKMDFLRRFMFDYSNGREEEKISAEYDRLGA